MGFPGVHVGGSQSPSASSQPHSRRDVGRIIQAEMLSANPRAIVALTCLAAVVVFAAVQDRVTAAGARSYVTLQREALAGLRDPITIRQVMDPAIARSVFAGALAAAGVLAVGLCAAAAANRDRPVPPSASPSARDRAAR